MVDMVEEVFSEAMQDGIYPEGMGVDDMIELDRVDVAVRTEGYANTTNEMVAKLVQDRGLYSVIHGEQGYDITKINGLIL